jgi:hypothetical protein
MDKNSTFIGKENEISNNTTLKQKTFSTDRSDDKT